LTDETVLEILRAVQADLSFIKADLAEKGDMLIFLQTAAVQQFHDEGGTREERQHFEILLSQIYHGMATGPEIAELRSDVSASRRDQRELDLRLSVIETHLGIRNPLKAGIPFNPQPPDPEDGE